MKKIVGENQGQRYFGLLETISPESAPVAPHLMCTNQKRLLGSVWAKMIFESWVGKSENRRKGWVLDAHPGGHHPISRHQLLISQCLATIQSRAKGRWADGRDNTALWCMPVYRNSNKRKRKGIMGKIESYKIWWAHFIFGTKCLILVRHMKVECIVL